MSVQVPTVQMFMGPGHGLWCQLSSVGASVPENPSYSILTPGSHHAELHTVNDDQSKTVGCQVENNLLKLNIRARPG